MYVCSTHAWLSQFNNQSSTKKLVYSGGSTEIGYHRGPGTNRVLLDMRYRTGKPPFPGEDRVEAAIGVKQSGQKRLEDL